MIDTYHAGTSAIGQVSACVDGPRSRVDAGDVRLGCFIALAACGYQRGVAPSAFDAPVTVDVAIDAPPAMCMGAWCRRKAIALHGTVGGPHGDFPIVFDLASDAELAAATRTDGFDLLFTDAGGGKLASERTA